MKLVIGVSCLAGSKALLQRVHETPVLRITMNRIRGLSANPYALVPWGPLHDGLAEEVKGWGNAVLRCYPEKGIAMRDLIVMTDADVGVLVDGLCALVDRDEIRVAAARADIGLEHSAEHRIIAYDRKRWLRVSESEEWPMSWTISDILKLAPSANQDALYSFNARKEWMEHNAKEDESKQPEGPGGGPVA